MIPQSKPKPQLTLFDSVCIAVGIVIGSGIFETSPFIASLSGSLLVLLSVWVAGGLISLIGAMCYAELATSLPHDGGDYVFLTRAYGSWVGFLFAWTEYWIVRPGNVGMLAFVFARYAHQIYPGFNFATYACVPVVVLTLTNALGVRAGKTTQNILTVVKVGGLFVVAVVAMFLPTPAEAVVVAPEAGIEVGSLRLAVILVLFTYGGWNDISYVAAEVKNPQQNVFRALFLSIATITTVYVVINLAFAYGLGMQAFGKSSAIAADVMRPTFGESGARLASVLVCLSCLGAINGMMIAGSRLFYATGTDHRFFRWLGEWNVRFDAPIHALLLQALVTVGLIVGFREGGFKSLAILTGIYWIFPMLVGLSVIVLRIRQPELNRPHKVLLFPLTPLLFSAIAGALLHSAATYAWTQWSGAEPAARTMWTIGIAWVAGAVVTGIVMSFLNPSPRATKPQQDHA